MNENYLRDKEFFDIIKEDIQKQREKSVPFFLLFSIPGAVATATLMSWLLTLSQHHQTYSFLLIPLLFAFLGYLFLSLKWSMDYIRKRWDNTTVDKKVDDWMKKYKIEEV